MARTPADQYFDPDSQAPYRVYAQVFDRDGNQVVTGQLVGEVSDITEQVSGVSVTDIYNKQP